MQHRRADHRRQIEAKLAIHEQSLKSVRGSGGHGGHSRAVLLHHARKISEARSELARLDANDGAEGRA
jgi:hypothetical protein